MEENKKFPLSHTILYCKGWYDQSENVFDDLRKTLTADGYSGEIFSDNDIIRLLIDKMDEYYPLFKKADNSFGISSMYDYIERYDRLEDGFKEKSIEYKLWRFFRCYAFELDKESFTKKEPDYTILPKKRWYKKDWLDRKLYPVFESWCYNYDFNTTYEFKDKVINKALKHALIEVEKVFPDMLEEYDNKEKNVIDLVKEDYIARYINSHKRLFNDLTVSNF